MMIMLVFMSVGETPPYLVSLMLLSLAVALPVSPLLFLHQGPVVQHYS